MLDKCHYVLIKKLCMLPFFPLALALTLRQAVVDERLYRCHIAHGK